MYGTLFDANCKEDTVAELEKRLQNDHKRHAGLDPASIILTNRLDSGSRPNDFMFWVKQEIDNRIQRGKRIENSRYPSGFVLLLRRSQYNETGNPVAMNTRSMSDFSHSNMARKTSSPTTPIR